MRNHTRVERDGSAFGNLKAQIEILKNTSMRKCRQVDDLRREVAKLKSEKNEMAKEHATVVAAMRYEFEQDRKRMGDHINALNEKVRKLQARDDRGFLARLFNMEVS